MRRAMDAHLKATRLFPSISSLSSSSSFSTPTPLLSIRAILTLPHPQNPSISKTLNLHSIATSWCSTILGLRSQPQIGSKFNVLVVRCVSRTQTNWSVTSRSPARRSAMATKRLWTQMLSPLSLLEHTSPLLEYEVREKPALHTWMDGGLDYIMLPYLNVDGIRTIGSVLGQSIALDYYVRQVDGMVAEFTDINRGMETTGKFKMKRKKLFQLWERQILITDVILKLGLFERF